MIIKVFILSLLLEEMVINVVIHFFFFVRRGGHQDRHSFSLLFQKEKNGHANILSYTGHKDITATISFYCLTVVKVLFCRLTAGVNPKICIVCPKLNKRSF